MADEAFQPGDTVRLRSGGALMTVESVNDEDDGKVTVSCVWMEKVGNRQEVIRNWFYPVTLEKDDDTPIV